MQYFRSKKFSIKKIIFLFFLIYFFKYKIKTSEKSISIYKEFIKNCNELKLFYPLKNEVNNFPYLSICIPTFNMEKYIERAIISILNQSFQDFEIIIINDLSDDGTENIIKRLKKSDKRIKLINHNKNLCTYFSRIDGVLNSKGEYIIFLDPDDMFINSNLFQKLFEYNLKYNFDILEFTVYYQNEEKKKIFFPSHHKLNHYHNFKKNIIYQPELSNILFYDPQMKQLTDIICRSIWNKIIKKKLLLKSIIYINKYYRKECFNYAEDTFMNIINFQFASNYSCINLPGYLYNIRKTSISHGIKEKNHEIMIIKSCLLYIIYLFKYIKDFNKDINYLFNELSIISKYLFVKGNPISLVDSFI